MGRSDMIIVAGDKVELFKEGGLSYKTVVEEAQDDGEMYAIIPSRLGVPMPLYERDTVFLAFFRESGRYVVPAMVNGFKSEGNVKLDRLLQTGEPEREQRRGYFRLPIQLKALICPYPDTPREYFPNMKDEWKDEIIETAATVNISVSGTALITKMEMKGGDRYLLKVYLNWPTVNSPPYIICTEVKRTSYRADRDRYQTGLHYIDHNDSMREHIAKYILLQQQKQIQRKRFVEGE